MNSKVRNKVDYLFLFFKGLAMGAANKVPGVSGGIVAFVGGFYEEFIYSLQKFNIKSVKLLFKRGWKPYLDYINARFLATLIAGTTVSYFSVSKLLDVLIAKSELYVWAWFFGLIIGSIYYMSKDFNLLRKTNIFYICVGIIAGISISFLEPATENDNLWFVFLCGIISVSGMTLPGLSGSFILILLGNYVLLLVDSVNALFDTLVNISQLNFDFLKDNGRIRLLQVLLIFTIGSVFGLVSFSHLLGYVLKRYKVKTYAIIIGFITGSLGVVWPWKKTIYETDTKGNLLLDANNRPIIDYYHRFLPKINDTETWWVFFFIIVGILLLLLLAWYGKKNKKNA